MSNPFILRFEMDKRKRTPPLPKKPVLYEDCPKCGTKGSDWLDEYNFVHMKQGEAQEDDFDETIYLCYDCLNELRDLICVWIHERPKELQ